MMPNRLLVVMATLLATLWTTDGRAADEFLEPDVAFKLSVRSTEGQRLEIRFDVAPGYYLYAEKLKVEAVPTDVKLGPLQVPKGKVKYDETFQKDVETLRDRVTMTLPLIDAPSSSIKLLITSQGCADRGLCYPPTQRAVRVDPVAPGGLARVSLLTEAQDAAWTPALSAIPPASAADRRGVSRGGDSEPDFAAVLGSHNLMWVAGAFLLGGVLLSFTPCVLPMVPILSSIIVGQSGAVTRARGFRLALVYALGMALVYTGFGVAAGLAGEGLAAALQNAWVLGAFATVLVALSLSMFGAYELQMPNAIQSRFARWSGRLQGGRDAGVFLMGGVSAVIVGPCVAAPLAGALVYISQTRDVVLGGVALFAMAIGMSVPLLLVGLSAGSVLPRAGAWMERIKHGFGFMLLGVALWMVSPVIPTWAFMLGLAALALACAVYLGAFERIEHTMTPPRAMTKAAGLLFALLAVLQLAGAASGGRNPLQPLAHWSAGGGAPGAPRAELAFQPVANLAALDAALQAASRPVMLDFYADWCVSCKEMEGLTFTDDAVRQRLAGMTLLRVDVTANSADDKALMRRYGLFGPPALLFFQPGGGELTQSRVIGYQDARTFLEHLNRIHGPGDLRLSAK
jgi:thioredoxin:protein disulfide reductase